MQSQHSRPQASSPHFAIHKRATQHNTTQHNKTQHNTTQHNTTQHNTTQQNTTKHNTTTRHDTTRHDTTRHDTTRHDTTRHDTTRHDTTRHDTTRHDTTRHDTTRHNTTQHNTTHNKEQHKSQHNTAHNTRNRTQHTTQYDTQCSQINPCCNVVVAYSALASCCCPVLALLHQTTMCPTSAEVLQYHSHPPSIINHLRGISAQRASYTTVLALPQWHWKLHLSGVNSHSNVSRYNVRWGGCANIRKLDYETLAISIANRNTKNHTGSSSMGMLPRSPISSPLSCIPESNHSSTQLCSPTFHYKTHPTKKQTAQCWIQSKALRPTGPHSKNQHLDISTSNLTYNSRNALHASLTLP